MERNQIIKAVQARINEVTAKNSIDVIPNGLIEQLLDSAALSFLMTVPVKLLPKTSASPVLVANTDGTGYFPVPSDYLRLVQFIMDDWTQPVVELYVEGTLNAKLQHFKYTRGTFSKPAGILSVDDNGLPCIYYYSTLSSVHVMSRFVYVKKELPENLPEVLIDLFAWYTCSLVLQAKEESELSKLALDRFSSLVTQYNNAA